MGSAMQLGGSKGREGNAWLMRFGVGIASFLMALALCFGGTARADGGGKNIQFSIPAQPLSSALIEFSRQANVQVLTAGSQLDGVSTRGVSGTYSVGAALQQLLAGTGFGYRMTGSDTVSLVAPPGTRSEAASAAVAQAEAPVSDVPPNTGAAQTAQDEKAKEQNAVQLHPVEVTGSRLPRTAKEGSQEVMVYSKTQIDQSGQATVLDFLNTLPDVSVGQTANGVQTFGGIGTVQLHGLPLGTTLVLVNGRRVEAAGLALTGGSYFDLSNIPLGSVERIEVVPTGSSAVYGSDAIAGVVNVILRNNYNGVEANARYGWADGTDEHDDNIGWGHVWGKASLSALVNFQTRSELQGYERSIVANGDHTQDGGPNLTQYAVCSPGNVFFPNGFSFDGGKTTVQYAAVPKGYTGAPSLQEFAGTAGALNTCNGPFTTGASLIDSSRRLGAYLTGKYAFTESVEVFTELLYSHNQTTVDVGPALLFGQPGFQVFSVPASNPYNPFGQTVGIAATVNGLPNGSNKVDTVFFRPLVGFRGLVFQDWQWELTAWGAMDRTSFTLGPPTDPPSAQTALNSTDPATALNPFVDGPWASQQILNAAFPLYLSKYTGRTSAANGLVRGPLVNMASGPLSIVVGAEYDRDTIFENNINDVNISPGPGSATYHRDSHAAFAEARVPILANHPDPSAGDILAVSLAGRYDSYSDFGDRVTPQLGAEWRPSNTLLVRSTYGRAFRAPPLFDLHEAQETNNVVGVITDPLNSSTSVVAVTNGGNPNLSPETGQSRSFGFVYSSKTVPNLQLSVTHWGIDMKNNIQQLNPQTIVNNESAFPGAVVRGPSQNGKPGPILSVDATFRNFGEINVRGFDYQLSYRKRFDFGELLPSLNVTQVYHYVYQLIPGAPPTDATSKAQDSGTWSPRWKGTAALGWKLGPYSASFDARYVGHYQDYDSTRSIGDFWLYDANARYALGRVIAADNPWLRDLYLEVGGVNLFNTLPQFSNFDFGFPGYDVSQGDIRGRFLYAQIGAKL